MPGVIRLVRRTGLDARPAGIKMEQPAAQLPVMFQLLRSNYLFLNLT